MESNTKIIELFGIPGSGKTTLARSLAEGKRIDNSFGRTEQLFKSYCRLPFIKKIVYLPFKSWWLIFSFLLSMPILPIKKWRLYKPFFYLSLVYPMKTIMNYPNYVIIDHGLIQSVMTLTYGHCTELSSKSMQLLMKIVRRLNIDVLAYCQIAPQVSLKRIRKRNRQDRGRLDKISSDEKLLIELGNQDKFYYDIIDKLINNNINIRYIDMENLDVMSLSFC